MYLILSFAFSLLWYYYDCRQFKDSELSEMKVDATTYTASEMEPLAAAAADLNLGVYPNKEVCACRWRHLYDGE